jgi:glycosyltransferase involved in cell wall biosynthesis
MKKIGLVIPSLKMGGMERVMTNLANELILHENLNIRIIKLTKGFNFYSLHEKVELVEPDFKYQRYSRIKSRIKTVFYVRKQFKLWEPDVILSFGDRFNSISLVASIGLGIPVFISNRMNPNLSNGKIIDILNNWTYPRAAGIVAQTNLAASVFRKRYHNKNIKVVSNPVRQVELPNDLHRQKVILNVGRFSGKKNQKLLVDYFLKLNAPDWKLIFLGDGPQLEMTIAYTKSFNPGNRIEFMGAISDVNHYYQSASIFAFTSTSEGFPNALGEAMSNGMACISFDCVAGPSDMIDHGINGYLVENFDGENYIALLQSLIDSEEKSRQFGSSAKEKMKGFSSQEIAKKYLDFLLNE